MELKYDDIAFTLRATDKDKHAEYQHAIDLEIESGGLISIYTYDKYHGEYADFTKDQARLLAKKLLQFADDGKFS